MAGRYIVQVITLIIVVLRPFSCNLLIMAHKHNLVAVIQDFWHHVKHQSPCRNCPDFCLQVCAADCCLIKPATQTASLSGSLMNTKSIPCLSGIDLESIWFNYLLFKKLTETLKMLLAPLVLSVSMNKHLKQSQQMLSKRDKTYTSCRSRKKWDFFSRNYGAKIFFLMVSN